MEEVQKRRKRRRLGCVNPAARLPLAAGGEASSRNLAFLFFPRKTREGERITSSLSSQLRSLAYTILIIRLDVVRPLRGGLFLHDGGGCPRSFSHKRMHRQRRPDIILLE